MDVPISSLSTRDVSPITSPLGRISSSRLASERRPFALRVGIRHRKQGTPMCLARAVKPILLLLLLFVATLCFAEANTPAAAAPSGAATSPNARIVENYGKLPLSFEANRGQTDSRVRFISRGQGYTLFLTSREAVLTLAQPVAKRGRPDTRSKAAVEEGLQGAPFAVVSLQLAGAKRKPVMTQEDELPAKSNYFIGNDPANWRTNVSHYGRVRYHEIYPGIDLVYYGNQRQLEHDFVVAPGADPSQIKLRLRGVHALRVDEGDLVMSTAQGELRLLKPEIYQEVNGQRRQVSGRYVLKGNEVGFAMAKFDHSRPLVIDPVLSYSTYLGGSNWDYGYGIAVDSSGNAYVVGSTFSANFPTLGPIEGSLHGDDYGDVFVAKFSTTGTLLYSTYLGGGNEDDGYAVAVDSSGNAYITGYTASFDFPTVNPYQSTPPSDYENAFVAKLNSSGSALLYSTYFGGSNPGSNSTVAVSIAVDSSGNAYITGQTNSTNLPIVNGPYATFNGYYTHAFVAEFNASGTAVTYSTYLEGSGYDNGTGIDLDNAGYIYVTGSTDSTDFPTTSGAFQTTPGFIFVTKLKPDGSLPVYSTYLGNTTNGNGPTTGIAVDRPSGKAYVTGFAQAYTTTGTVLPVTANAFQQTMSNAGPYGVLWMNHAFVAALAADGSAVLYCTYLGGSSSDYAYAIALDSSGNAYVTGTTSSRDFPMQNPIQSSNNAPRTEVNAFVTKLNTDFSALIYSTYLGGSGLQGDQGNGIAVDSSGNAYVTGHTSSTDFPIANAFQSSYGGGNFDAFVAKISSGALASAVLSVTPSTLAFTATVGGSIPAGQPITITNTGGGTLNWTASYTSSWLSLDSSSGTAPATIHVYANTATLAAGTYNDTITVTASGATGSPATVAVTLTVADFQLSADASSLDLQRGQTGTIHLTVTPLTGFNQTVSLACSGLPSGAGCSFSPASVTPQGSAVISTLTVSTGSVAQQRRNRHLPWTATSVMLAVCSLGLGVRRSRRLAALLLLLLAVTAGGLLIGCGGGFNGTAPVSAVPATATTTKVTVTATAGSLQHQVTFALTIH